MPCSKPRGYGTRLACACPAQNLEAAERWKTNMRFQHGLIATMTQNQGPAGATTAVAAAPP
eukprot:6061890-Lingulodinium_polyedra.AAC.1